MDFTGFMDYTMFMDDLSKQQLILLALLVSFVTSLATGIVTVSLMDQAPSGVTRTVSQVIERTIQQISPDNSATAVISAGDESALAVSAVSGSLVRLSSRDGQNGGGLGLLVSTDGVILSDKAAVAGLTDYQAILPDGVSVPVSVIQSQNDGDIVFLAPVRHLAKSYAAIRFGTNPSLGATVYSLTGSTTTVLGQGIVTESMSAAASSTPPSPGSIHTSIPPSKVSAGSPLFTLDGSVIGMRTSSLSTADGSEFYPISQLKSVIPRAQ